MRRKNGLRSRLRRDNGAVLLEAALVTPLLLVLLMGIIEYGLYFKNVSSASAAAASGARAAVTQSRSNTYSSNAELSVAAALNAISNTTPLEIVVYRADPATGRPCTSAYGSACSSAMANGTSFDLCTECYIWDFTDGSWSIRGGATSPSPAWDATNQMACGTVAKNDYLGVYVYLRHNMISGMFGSSQPIKEKTVMRLEPVPVSGGSACS